ncbi:HAMP domain-containing sensor histidine kinase [Streptococcus penaeicida]|uniref:HAMP domain-containing sensor histidine kinase n=2 Tax=Streptococcus penaeicida TaxID=1765960 RepID=UPI0039EE6C2F
MTKSKELQWSLRSYFVFLFIAIIIITNLISFAVIMLLKEGLKVEAPLFFWLMLYTLLTILVGGVIMWQGSIHLTRPIQELNQAVIEVSQGNFDYQIIRKTYPKDKATYHNEIDQLSQNVNQMAQDLKNLAQLRQDFISNISHELKTPVASLVGLTDLLSDSHLEGQEQAELLALMQSETLRLSRLCDDILNLSRLDRQTDLRIEKVRIDEQIRHVLILLSEKWRDKDIIIDFDSPAIYLGTDADLSMQIWINLIDNAIKYSGDKVKLGIYLIEQDKGLEILISDHGIGIEESKQRYLFQQFYQADQSHNREGNGLGLAIVKRIITLLEGKISLQSQVGKGTTVTVYLPNHRINQ